MKWEYRVAWLSMKVRMERQLAYKEGRKPLIDSFEQALNVLGEVGWELVAIQTPRFDKRDQVFAYLKRPKPES